VLLGVSGRKPKCNVVVPCIHRLCGRTECRKFW
jgi:hypothetical protein